MNRPKITKQTLKELRGDLLTKQTAQKQIKNNENENKIPSKGLQKDEMDIGITQEEENEMNM